MRIHPIICLSSEPPGAVSGMAHYPLEDKTMELLWPMWPQVSLKDKSLAGRRAFCLIYLKVTVLGAAVHTWPGSSQPRFKMLHVFVHSVTQFLLHGAPFLFLSICYLYHITFRISPVWNPPLCPHSILNSRVQADGNSESPSCFTMLCTGQILTRQW